MRPISWKLSAGILTALCVSSWSQTAATLPSVAGPRAAAPILAGTTRGEARRKALLVAVEDWKSFLPASQDAPLTKKFSPELHEIKDAATGLKPGEAVEPLEKRFKDWQQLLLSELYNQNPQRYFNDPERFSEAMQERLDTLAAIRGQKARAPQRVKQLDTLAAQVSANPDRATLDRIYDKVGASRTSLHSSPVRMVTFSAPTKSEPQADPGIRFSDPKSYSPEKLSAPPATFQDASYKKPAPASTWTLSSIISSVSSTARRYANQVAGAIVNYSRSLGLDEKLQAAVIWAESAFNPGATSGSGAMGLGQLMPGTASGLGVHNAYDINQNVKGSSKFLKALLNHFTSADEIKYTQGLYAWGKDRVTSGQPVEAVWKDVFAKTPLGVKNAIASYNAGQGAIDYYAHGDYMRLPRSYSTYARKNGVGYWQTINYVPAVLRHYFDIQLKTPSGPSSSGLSAI